MEQQIIMNDDLPQEDPSYVEEMAKKGEAAVQAGNTHREQQDAPSIPKKFLNEDGSVNVEAMAKSYSELEKKLSQPKAQATTPTDEPKEAPKQDKPTEDSPKETPKVENEGQARELVTSKGIDFDGLAREFSASGNLSEETYTRLEAAGINKDTVDAYIQGQVALAEKYQNEAMDAIGGKEAYQAMAEWAKDNLAPGQLKAYNQAVASYDMDTVNFAVQGLKAQYDKANGAAPKRQLMGNTGSSGEAIQPFRSRTQYVDAIKDPRYERDSAYRADVLERLQRSDIF